MDVKLPEDTEWFRIHRDDIVQINKEHIERTSTTRGIAQSGERSEKLRRIALRSPVKPLDLAPPFVEVESDNDSIPGAPGTA